MKSIICEASSIAKAIEQCWQKAGMPQNFSVKVLEKDEKNFLGMTKKPAKIALFFEERFEPQKKRPDLKDGRDNRRISNNNNHEKLAYEKDKSLQENLKSLQQDTQKSIQKIQTQIKPQAQNKTPIKPQVKTQEQVRMQGQIRQFDKTNEQVKPQPNSQIRPQAQVRPLEKNTSLGQGLDRQVQGQQTSQLGSQQREITQKAPSMAKDTQEANIRKSPWNEQMVEISSAWMQGMLEEMNLKDIKFSVNVSSNNIRFHFDKTLIANKNEQKELFRNFAFLLMQTLRYKFKKQFRNLKAVFTCNIS